MRCGDILNSDLKSKQVYLRFFNFILLSSCFSVFSHWICFLIIKKSPATERNRKTTASGKARTT